MSPVFHYFKQKHVRKNASFRSRRTFYRIGQELRMYWYSVCVQLRLLHSAHACLLQHQGVSEIFIFLRSSRDRNLLRIVLESLETDALHPILSSRLVISNCKTPSSIPRTFTWSTRASWWNPACYFTISSTKKDTQNEREQYQVLLSVSKKAENNKKHNGSDDGNETKTR